MTVSLKEMMNRLTNTERDAVDARAKELIRDEYALRAIRKAIGRTQKDIACEMGVSQDVISRLENRNDLLLSTLRKYVGAIGGTVKIVVETPEHGVFELQGLSALLAGKQVASAKGSRGRPKAPKTKAA